MDKAALRERLLAARRALSDEFRQRLGARIQERVLSSPVWETARCLGCYLALPDEVPTQRLIVAALAQNKTIAAPVILPGSDHMSYRRFDTLAELRPGPFGILQPLQGQEVPSEAINFLLVPGVGFDLQGYRLGYGRGYFDRFLTGYAGYSLGIAFEVQIVAALPVSLHDRPVRQVLTEERSIFAA